MNESVETLPPLSRKEKEVVDEIKSKNKLGHYHGHWISWGESRTGSFPKKHNLHMRGNVCDKLVENGVIIQKGTFIGPSDNVYERYILKQED